MTLSREDVAELLRLLDAVPADELDLETERFRLVLRRAGDGGWTQETEVRAAPDRLRAADDEPEAADAEAADDAVTTADAVTAAAAGAAAGADREGLVTVTAPLLGTFYRSPKPGAPPFVEVGSAVGETSVIGLVETMKLFNSVPAGVSGTVAEICVDDAQFVERGTVLLRVQPDG